VQALQCYNACMQYTIRNIPKPIDRALRAKARKERKSLNQAAIEALSSGLNVTNQPKKYRDLSDLAGTWIEDPEFDKAIEAQDQIDPEMWR
jgi:plasmid stability protein